MCDGCGLLSGLGTLVATYVLGLLTRPP
jgi:hypothetical protein